MIIREGETEELQAAQDCTLNGFKFKRYDWIRITMCRDWDTEDGFSGGGSWGWGGYTVQKIKSIASKIEDRQTGSVIYEK
jgi:hypothetical protein